MPTGQFVEEPGAFAVLVHYLLHSCGNDDDDGGLAHTGTSAEFLCHR